MNFVILENTKNLCETLREPPFWAGQAFRVDVIEHLILWAFNKLTGTFKYSPIPFHVVVVPIIERKRNTVCFNEIWEVSGPPKQSRNVVTHDTFSLPG